MMQSKQPMVLLGLLAMAVCSGCQTFGTATVRGQSPAAGGQGGDTPKIRGLYHTPVRSAAAELQDIHHEHHNTDTYYYGPGGPAAAGYQSCPPGGSGNCPPAYAGQNCPPQGYQECPPGQGHGCRSGLCQDRFSYGYQVPNDLVYPPAGGVGGAVVYPYYTHKGPSDFFRQ
ncbi:hypothetical protein SH661x_001687 [Planctomicrobium sp. SH661]|uniref:hypothetical protein n=1 Tax=Planctomicrobium sp. SH661 TaxID=3448124 RepID=UPI003F5BE3C3